MFSSEDEIIHHVRSVLNASVLATKSDKAVDHSLPSVPGAGGKAKGHDHHSQGEDQVCKWKKLFYYYDDDKGGALNFKEFRKLVRASLHVSESKLPDKDLKLLFERIDFDNSGEIEFEEFYKYIKLRTKESEELPRTLGRALRLALARLRVKTEADLRALFDNLDFDADGGITLHQLRRLIREELRLNKHEFSDYYVKRLMHSVDTDNTGQIEFDEFVKFINDHISLGGIAESTGVKQSSSFGSRTNNKRNALQVAPQLSLMPSSSESEQHQQHQHGGEKHRGGHTPKGGHYPISHPAPYTGCEKPRGYFTLPGAKRLNRVEERLFDAGFDIRGKYFKVAEEASENTLGGKRFGQRPSGKLPGIASAPNLKLPAAFDESGDNIRMGRRTTYLREVAKSIL